MEKNWIVKGLNLNKIDEIKKQTGLSDLAAKILVSRGFEDIDKINDFLTPTLDKLHNPFLLNDMDIAVERLQKAIDNNEKILIYGDYDVDGVTSTTILYNFFSHLNLNIDYFIPDRFADGYGLSIKTCNSVSNLSPDLVITVDCGITSIDEIDCLNTKNIDVIITDHHTCGAKLPEALAVINPNREDSTYPFKGLAGVGVAYKLIESLCIKLNLGQQHLNYLDIVAIGTVADIVPLENENRIIVANGLNKIKSTSNVGLKELIEVTGLSSKPITSTSIGFVLGPRINAAGRMGAASLAVKLLTTKNRDEAFNIANELIEKNKQRQDMESEIVDSIISKIESDTSYLDDKVLVVEGEHWHHGIIGIVASKVTEKYYKPTIIISIDDNIGKASARSIDGFNLYNALENSKDLLLKFGGHKKAAGLSISPENIKDFRKAINEYANETIKPQDLIPKIYVDTQIYQSDINIQSITELDKLAPFGECNPSPLFLYKTSEISEQKWVGNGNHLKLKVINNNTLTDAIGFSMERFIDVFKAKDCIDIVCSLDINEWNNNRTPQLMLKDIKSNRLEELEDNYYTSLDSFKVESKTTYFNFCKIESPNLPVIENQNSLVDQLTSFNKLNQSCIILVSLLDDFKKLLEIIENSNPDIKNYLKLTYNKIESFPTNSSNVLVNPNLKDIDFSKFDNIIIFDNFLSINKTIYLDNLSKNNNLMVYKDEFSTNISNHTNLLISRDDIAYVYKYLKSSPSTDFTVNNLFGISKLLLKNSKGKFNYFKFKKSIEILEELNLITTKKVDSCGMMFSMNKSVIKTELKSSNKFLQYSQMNIYFAQ